MTERGGRRADRDDEWALDSLVINAMGLGFHQVIEFLFQTGPSFSEFEDWIVQTAGAPDPRTVARANAQINGEPCPGPTQERLDAIDRTEPVLTEEDLRFWEDYGYVILTEAVPREGFRAAEAAIWEFTGADPADPETWYGAASHGIMVEFIQHEAFKRNRRSVRMHKAFAQLWGTADLWVTSDRCGFNPPQREDFPFPGPDLHWDLDFGKRVEFGTQGILYLTDTPAEQGALTLVPGFHKRLDDWLAGLPAGSDPQKQDLHALGSTPVAAMAGDMVIWDQRLPHGPRPNLGDRPRIVQYINMVPGVRREG
jgi:hypothetical protein